MGFHLTLTLRCMRSTKLQQYLDDHGLGDVEGASRVKMHRVSFIFYKRNGIHTKKLAQKFADGFCENDYHIFLDSPRDYRALKDYDF